MIDFALGIQSNVIMRGRGVMPNFVPSYCF